MKRTWRSSLLKGVVTLGVLALLLSVAGNLAGTALAAQAQPATPHPVMALAARPGVGLGHQLHPQVPQCYLSYCDGDDPYSDHCNSGTYYVVASSPLEDIDKGGTYSWNYGYIQLWWSNTCRANWTVTVVKQATYPAAVSDWVFTDDGRNEPGGGYPLGNGTYHSPILIAPNNLACSEMTVTQTPGDRFAGATGQTNAYTCPYA
jgi:hypothetical protein